MRKNVERSWKSGIFVECEVDGIPIRGWGIVVGPYDEAESLVLIESEGEEEIEDLPMELEGMYTESPESPSYDFLMRCEIEIHEEVARISQERKKEVSDGSR